MAKAAGKPRSRAVRSERLTRMNFDTDILIWAARGRAWAQSLLTTTPNPAISAAVWMELVQGARNKSEIRMMRAGLLDLPVRIILFSEAITARAIEYHEEFSLTHGISILDALIAATAVEQDAVLATCNDRHFRIIPSLKIKVYRDFLKEA